MMSSILGEREDIGLKGTAQQAGVQNKTSESSECMEGGWIGNAGLRLYEWFHQIGYIRQDLSQPILASHVTILMLRGNAF